MSNKKAQQNAQSNTEIIEGKAVDVETGEVMDSTQETAEEDTTAVAVKESISDLAVSADDVAGKGMLSALTHPQGDFFCSIQDDGTRASKVKIYNAVNTADGTVKSQINKVLTVTDVVAHTVRLKDDKGVYQDCIRTVLITADGKRYQAVSEGIVSALQRIFIIVGKPSWKDEPIQVAVTEVPTKAGRSMLNLDLLA